MESCTNISEFESEDINSTINLIDENYVAEKNTLDKYFGRIESGSLRAGIMNLSILSVGISSLSLPKKFSSLSVLVTLIVIILGGIAAIWSLRVLINASIQCKKKSYSEVLNYYLGNKATIVLNIIITIMVCGMVIVFQMLIYKMIASICFEFMPRDKKLNLYQNSIELFLLNSIFGMLYFRFILIISVSIFIVIPLNLLKNISKLRFVSIFGIICLFLIASVIVIQLPMFVYKYKDNKFITNNINWFNIKKGFEFPEFLFFKGTSLVVYAYNCHYGLFPVYEQLYMSNTRRINKVIKRSILLDLCFYIVLGLSGYFTQPHDVPNIILDRNQLGNSDYLMTLCKFFTCLLLFAKIPVNFNTCRIALISLFFKDNELTLYRNLIITIPITLVLSLFSVFFKDVSDILSFLGGVCSITIAFLYPTLIYIKQTYVSLKFKNGLIIISMSVLILIGYIGGILSLIDIIKGFRKT